MLYIVGTKKGIGVEIWGSYSDLFILRNFILKYSGIEEGDELTNRSKDIDYILFSFCYELRKAYENQRATRHYNHITFENEKLIGTRVSWVNIIFLINALKLKTYDQKLSKLHKSLILQLDYWIDMAMRIYDDSTHKKLKPFFKYKVQTENLYLFQLMTFIEVEYFKLGGGKKSFKRLPDLLGKSIPNTTEYYSFLNTLKAAAAKNNCKIEELEVSYDALKDSLIW